MPVTLAFPPLCVVCAQMLALLFMAFVVAGFVEELFKFLIVRFCNLGAPLRNPHTILIYLVRFVDFFEA
jgi:RsiW-degrading membrane proteinase PrsW (M82 family)